MEHKKQHALSFSKTGSFLSSLISQSTSAGNGSFIRPTTFNTKPPGAKEYSECSIKEMSPSFDFSSRVASIRDGTKKAVRVVEIDIQQSKIAKAMSEVKSIYLGGDALSAEKADRSGDMHSFNGKKKLSPKIEPKFKAKLNPKIDHTSQVTSIINRLDSSLEKIVPHIRAFDVPQTMTITSRDRSISFNKLSSEIDSSGYNSLRRKCLNDLYKKPSSQTFISHKRINKSLNEELAKTLISSSTLDMAKNMLYHRRQPEEEVEDDEVALPSRILKSSIDTLVSGTKRLHQEIIPVQQMKIKIDKTHQPVSMMILPTY